MRPIDTIVIHASDSSFGDANEIRRWHLENGWRDIGYHYVILNGFNKKNEFNAVYDGTVQSGRPLQIAGAHAKGSNKSSIGICMVGKFGEYTKQQEDSLLHFVVSLVKQYNISIDNIIGHYETPYEREHKNKTCPDMDMRLFRDKVAEVIFT